VATRADIVAAAREWVGTPFQHQGHTREHACDCLGLAYGVARSLGLTDTTLPAYGAEPNGDSLKQGLDREMDLVTIPLPGDLLVFRLATLWQHVGIYTGRNIIHAWQPNGRVVEHIFNQVWRRRHVASYRFRGLDNG